MHNLQNLKTPQLFLKLDKIRSFLYFKQFIAALLIFISFAVLIGISKWESFLSAYQGSTVFDDDVAITLQDKSVIRSDLRYLEADYLTDSPWFDVIVTDYAFGEVDENNIVTTSEYNYAIVVYFDKGDRPFYYYARIEDDFVDKLYSDNPPSSVFLYVNKVRPSSTDYLAGSELFLPETLTEVKEQDEWYGQLIEDIVDQHEAGNINDSLIIDVNRNIPNLSLAWLYFTFLIIGSIGIFILLIRWHRERKTLHKAFQNLDSDTKLHFLSEIEITHVSDKPQGIITTDNFVVLLEKAQILKREQICEVQQIKVPTGQPYGYWLEISYKDGRETKKQKIRFLNLANKDKFLENLNHEK